MASLFDYFKNFCYNNNINVTKLLQNDKDNVIKF